MSIGSAMCFSVELNFYPDTFPLAHSSDSVINLTQISQISQIPHPFNP